MKKKNLHKAFAAEMAVQYRNWAGHTEVLHALAIVQEGIEQIFAQDKGFDLEAFKKACHSDVPLGKAAVALSIIANKQGFSNSFLWSEMKEIAKYALTGKHNPSATWPMSDEDKKLIDEA
jgi:hypothetical protein